MYRFLIAAAALTLVPTASAADCAMTGLETTVVTKPDAAIIGSGGILVAATPVTRDTPDKTPGNKPGWRLRAAGGKLVAPKIDKLAPGLFVYRVEATSQDKPIELEDEKHVVVGKVLLSKAKVAPYPAPKVKKLEYLNQGMRRSSQSITATLAIEPPAGTYALVIADAKGKPLSWGPVRPGITQQPFTHDDCQVLPDGMTSAMPGDGVMLFWVSTEGRLSDKTTLIKVGGKPDPY